MLKKIKKKYNYLRIYANLDKKSYETTEKEILVRALVSIAENFYPLGDLRFDIAGAGYGISKSSPYCLAKTFWEKFNKKGYEKMEGITIVHQDDMSLRLHCLLISPEENNSRLDIDIFWENNGNYDHENALKIALKLCNILKINYAYGYVCDEKLRSGEWVNKETWFSSTSYIPKEIQLWEEQIMNITKGAYRQLFDFNILNFKQIENISEPNTHFSKQTLTNELEIWCKTKKK